MSDEKRKNEKTWVEEIEVSGNEVVDRVKELIQQGNVRRLIVRKKNGETVIELPLTPTVIAAGALTVFAGPLMLLGAVSALVLELKLEVVRVVDEEDSDEPKRKVDIE